MYGSRKYFNPHSIECGQEERSSFMESHLQEEIFTATAATAAATSHTGRGSGRGGLGRNAADISYRHAELDVHLVAVRSNIEELLPIQQRPSDPIQSGVRNRPAQRNRQYRLNVRMYGSRKYFNPHSIECGRGARISLMESHLRGTSHTG